MTKEFSYTDGYGDTFPVRAELNMYRDNDNLYIGLLSFDEDLEGYDNYCDLTVNIVELPYLHSAVDLTYGTEEKIKFIQDNNLGEYAGFDLPSGFCIYPVYKFNPDVLMEINPDVFKDYQKAYGIVGLEDKKTSLESKINAVEERLNKEKDSLIKNIEHER